MPSLPAVVRLLCPTTRERPGLDNRILIDGHELDLGLEQRPERARALEALDLELLANPGFGRTLLNDAAAAATAGGDGERTRSEIHS